MWPWKVVKGSGSPTSVVQESNKLHFSYFIIRGVGKKTTKKLLEGGKREVWVGSWLVWEKAIPSENFPRKMSLTSRRIC